MTVARACKSKAGRLKLHWRHYVGAGALSVVLAVVGLACLVFVTAYRLGPPPLHTADDLSEVVADRHGRLLRAFTTADGRWRLPVKAAEVDRRYLDLLFAFEDRRFHQHRGVDPYAIARAAYQFMRHGRPVSGGSTLTMQVARLLDRRHDRSLTTKWLQIVRALQLETRLSKRKILSLYLRLAPFGGNLEGVRAASLAYFGKEPRRLSLSEAALLVALPQSPEARRPDRSPRAARRARDRVLARGVAAGVISRTEAARAVARAVQKRRLEFPKFAPHLTESIVATAKTRRVHRLSVDRDVQKRLEALARQGGQSLGRKLSVAILAVDHASGEILAHVGSSDYFSASRLGAINMVDAVRSPGSTLKPLIYGLAFEAGLAHPETFIEDRPVRFGTYAPKNFDHEYRGTVTIREALALSLNVPAVKVLDKVGPVRLVGRLRKSGVGPRLPEESVATLGVALGGLGLTLRELTQLYAGIANGGKAVRLRHTKRNKQEGMDRSEGSRALLSSPHPVLSSVAAWYVGDILTTVAPPLSAPHGQIAYKTGTSYGYRDAWAIGFDGRHTVGVWVGRADGTSTPGLTGRTAAAPILFDAFKRVAKVRTPLKPAPHGAVKTAAADLPPPLKRFREGIRTFKAGPYIDPPVRIAFPPDRSELEVAAPGMPVMFKASGGVLPLTWLIDDAPVGSSGHQRTFVWDVKSRGFVKVSVIDAKGRVDRVVVRLR